MNKVKYLHVAHADYYETYKEELLQSFSRQILPLKFCTMFPELLRLYTEKEEYKEQSTHFLLQSLSRSLFEGNSLTNILPEKKYVVCALAAGNAHSESQLVHILRTQGKRAPFIIQDSSVSACSQSLEETKADWGIALDLERDFSILVKKIGEIEGEDIPIIFTLLGFTFASLDQLNLLNILKGHMRPCDRFLVDIPLFEGSVVSPHLSSPMSEGMFSPLFHQEMLEEIIHFYGIPKKAHYTFHTEYRERNDDLGGFIKDMVITFQKPCTLHFRDISWTYEKSEALSLFHMTFFTLQGIQTLFQRQGFTEIDSIHLPSPYHLGSSLHILTPTV